LKCAVQGAILSWDESYWVPLETGTKRSLTMEWDIVDIVMVIVIERLVIRSSIHP